jgi:hypothetical protein
MGGRRIRTVRAILFAGGQFVNVKEIARWRFERTADSSCLAAPRVGMTTFLSSASFRESKFRFDTSELPGETAGPTRANVPARTADLAFKGREVGMSLSISSVPTTAAVTAANSGAAAAPAPQKVQQPVQTASADAVTLTAAQQVFQLYNQGKTVTQIATSLSLSVSLVNNYLGINASGG